ncbi:60S ribosomal export protein NMD3 [Candidatus Methanomassiliicoccus intestinalis]|uniref:60S ribosomal export protein NMD3 n=1 Tax=Candidatus Methanomassiliicoccus intestinalis TaxID=1406512 RepID=UPI0037DC8275
MFCVKCGKEGKTYESLCSECYLKSNRFTTCPEVSDLVFCAHCGEFQIGKNWEHFDSEEEAVKEYAIGNIMLRQDATLDAIECSAEHLDDKHYLVKILAYLFYEDLEVVEECTTTIRMRRNVCDRCNKIQGSYFESIVQIRPTSRRFSNEEQEEILSRVMKYAEGVAKNNRDAFISKVLEVHGGYDLYVSTLAFGKMIARDLISTYGAESKESSSIQGQKDGRNIYRVTYLVRLPSYRIRDIVEIKDKLYIITSTGPQTAKMRNIKNNESKTMMNVDLRDVRVVGTKEDFMDAVVLTETDREFQIMHPVTYKTVEIKKPRNFKRTGETIKVFSYEGELYFIGN